jgi:hypothetical protein
MDMHTREITTEKGNTYICPVFTADEYQDMTYGLSDNGWCLTCGELVDGVEPDARKYHCEVCDKKTIYGLEELLMMGILQIK